MKITIPIIIVALLLVILAIPIVQNGLRYGMTPITALFLPLHDGTTWSPNYTLYKFRSIKPGMTTTQVLAQLGPQLLTIHRKGQASWHYTLESDGQVMTSSTHGTHQRIIHFSTNSLVSHTTYAFSFD